jgi:hypothetical protein
VTFRLQVELQTFGQVDFVFNNQNMTHALLSRVERTLLSAAFDSL